MFQLLKEIYQLRSMTELIQEHISETQQKQTFGMIKLLR